MAVAVTVTLNTTGTLIVIAKNSILFHTKVTSQCTEIPSRPFHSGNKTFAAIIEKFPSVKSDSLGV